MYMLLQTPLSGPAHLGDRAGLRDCRAACAFGVRRAGAVCRASAEARAAHAERRGVLLGLSAAAAAALQLPALAADEGMHARPTVSRQLFRNTQCALLCN